MKNSVFWAMAIVAISFAACSPKTVDIKTGGAAVSDYDFSKAKSYQWKTPVVTINDPNQTRSNTNLNVGAELTFLIERELRARDLAQSKENPDLLLLVTLSIDMENQEAISDYKEGIEALYTLPKGGLTVSLVDAATNRVVWVGQADATIQSDPDEETVKKRLDAAVTGMFKTCPF